MKKSKFIPFLIFILFLSSCQKTDDGSFVEPITIYEKVAGNWYLTSLTMTDEIAKSSSIGLKDMQLISKLGFINFQIELKVNAQNQPESFQILGDSPELFLTSGYWSLDSAFPKTNGEPNYILLYSDVAKTQLVDKLVLTAIPSTTDVLEFKLVREVLGTPFVSYNFSLKPINNK